MGKCKRHLPLKVSFSIPFRRALVSHIYNKDNFAKQTILSEHIRFLIQAITHTLIHSCRYSLNIMQISCCSFTKIKCYLCFITSVLHPFFWAFGEGEGGVARFSGGCTAETAGTAPEGCGGAGAEVTGLLPGWVGQGPHHLPGGGWQMQDSHGRAGLSIHCILILYDSFKSCMHQDSLLPLMIPHSLNYSRNEKQFLWCPWYQCFYLNHRHLLISCSYVTVSISRCLNFNTISVFLEKMSAKHLIVGQSLVKPHDKCCCVTKLY